MRVALQPHHEPRLAQGDAQPLALADGETLQPVVLAHHATVGRHDLAGRFRRTLAAADERRVIAVGNEADLLAVFLVGHAQADLARHGPDLVLAILADGQQHRGRASCRSMPNSTYD